MASIRIRTAISTDIPQLLALNSQSLKEKLSLKEQSRWGFVLRLYPEDLVSAIMQLEPVLVAETQTTIVGYAYPTPDYFRNQIETLGKRLALFEKVSYRGKPITEYRFVEVGMIVVAREYRRFGVFKRLIEEMKQIYLGKYELLTARIALGNEVSVKAHRKEGFEVVAEESEGANRFYVLVKDLRPHFRL